MVFGIADDFHSPAVFCDDISLRNGVRSVVGAFGLNVRANFVDESANVKFGKNHYCINHRERSDDFGTLAFGHQRAAWALERTHRGVGVYCDYQLAAQTFCCMKITNMADVQQIESSVGERDAFTNTPPVFNAAAKLFAIQDFVFVVRSSTL